MPFSLVLILTRFALIVIVMPFSLALILSLSKDAAAEMQRRP